MNRFGGSRAFLRSGLKALIAWRDTHNRSWLTERHGFLSPEQAHGVDTEEQLLAA